MQRVYLRVTLEIQIAKTLQNEEMEIKLFGNGVVVLGLATSHCSGKCRYAWLIRPCITRGTRVFSLVVDSGPCYHPLLCIG